MGFCWSEGSSPTLNDYFLDAGPISETGEFSLGISGLQKNTDYKIKSFIINSTGVTYGDSQSFRTLGEVVGEWLHYDDGTCVNGIGFSTGVDFYVAIRFPKGEIQNHAGEAITKIRFFPKEGSPSEYYVTIWEGDDEPDLMMVEKVTNPNINGWTELVLSNPYPINTNNDLWVGYLISNYSSDTYPAGVDDGPAVTGLGDMISSDDGETWDALSLLDPPNLNYNWCLQAYVQNAKGETTMLSNKVKKPISPKTNIAYRDKNAIPQSKNQSKKQNNHEKF